MSKFWRLVVDYAIKKTIIGFSLLHVDFYNLPVDSITIFQPGASPNCDRLSSSDRVATAHDSTV